MWTVLKNKNNFHIFNVLVLKKIFKLRCICGNKIEVINLLLFKYKIFNKRDDNISIIYYRVK